MAGERLWATGQPSTPSRVIAARPSALRRALAALGGARGVVLRDVRLELRLGRGERVAAVATRLDDVEEVGLVRGMRRGLQRAEARVADRRRRQPLPGARVVGRVALQLRDA